MLPSRLTPQARKWDYRTSDRLSKRIAANMSVMRSCVWDGVSRWHLWPRRHGEGIENPRCSRTAQHFIARPQSQTLCFSPAMHSIARRRTMAKPNEDPLFKPVSVRVRTSLSTRASIDVRKRNFEARDFGLFEAQVRAGRHPETANVERTYGVTCGNVGRYSVANFL